VSSDPAQYQQYEAGEGTVTVTAATADRITGTFSLSATAKYPSSTGAPVRASGSFEATPAAGCSR